MGFENAVQLWREGERFAGAVAGPERDAVQRVVSALRAELRRRLGGTFTLDELVALYDRGTGWCLDIAARVAPSAPAAWDARVADAAFWGYAHDAVDFAGGRRVDAEP